MKIFSFSFFFLILFFFLFLIFIYFSIVNNLCRGSELSRDPGCNVGDVHYDCCFHSCYES